MATVKTVELVCDECDEAFEYSLFLHEGVPRLRQLARDNGWAYISVFEKHPNGDLERLRVDLCPKHTQKARS